MSNVRYTMEELKIMSRADGWDVMDRGESVLFITSSRFGEDFSFKARKNFLEWDIWDAVAEYDVEQETLRELSGGRSCMYGLKSIMASKEEILFKLSRLHNTFRPDYLPNEN